jgi:hypothetical protein
MHVQKSSPVAMDVVLTSSAGTWNDVFHAQGAGTGARELALDGAVELTPSAPLAAPVEVRVRFVPTAVGGAVSEEVRYVTSDTSFTAVAFGVTCQNNVPCVNEGTFEVVVVTPAQLGAATLNVHWVTTASLTGRGPAAPADATLRLTQP